MAAASCDEAKRTKRKQQKTTHARQEQVEQQPEPPLIHFSLDTLTDQAEVDAFKARYTPEQQRVILQLNRYSSEKLRKGIVLSIPDTVQGSFREYTTFPETLSFADTVPKLILVSLRIQSFALYETGKLIRTGPVSSGKKAAPTPPGRYHTNWKSKLKTSTIDDQWIMPWYFNIENKQGIAFHQYDLPGYAASHACIRLEEEDAKWIYSWADQWQLDSNTIVKNGTPVIVFGTYDFEGTQPWRLLPENPRVMELTEEELGQLTMEN